VEVPDLVVVHVELEDPHDARLQEEVGVLDGRRLGGRHDDAGIGAEEEVEGVERAARAEVEDDVRGRELADLAEEPELAVVGEVGDEEDVLRALDEAEVPERGRDGRGLEGRHGPGQEVAEVRVGGLDPQQGVEVGSPEVGVDQDDLAVERGQMEAEIRRDEALARSALAAANSPDALIHD
jgi:hypothetical protein